MWERKKSEGLGPMMRPFVGFGQSDDAMAIDNESASELPQAAQLPNWDRSGILTPTSTAALLSYWYTFSALPNICGRETDPDLKSISVPLVSKACEVSNKYYFTGWMALS